MTPQGRTSAGPTRRRLNADINVVPYIDVMLVLLIIFMVTAPLLTQGVEVQLPQTASEPVTVEVEPVSFSIDAKGRYFLDVGERKDQPLSDVELMRRVAIVLTSKPETPLLIRADARVDYGRVAHGLTLLQAAGASKLAFVTEPIARPEARR